MVLHCTVWTPVKASFTLHKNRTPHSCFNFAKMQTPNSWLYFEKILYSIRCKHYLNVSFISPKGEHQLVGFTFAKMRIQINNGFTL